MSRERDLRNRVEQLEDLRNIRTIDTADYYQTLAAGKLASTSLSSSNGDGITHWIPVPITLKAQLGSPTALAVGAFATTLTTTACALMEWRGLATTTAFIGNFCAVAGIGMVISAQWELVLGNTYAYTVLGAFGFFYLGFGFILAPFFGVADAYGGASTPGYNNALGFFTLLWSVWNFFFLIGSLPLNIVYIGIFLTVQGAFTLLSASYFLAADGNAGLASACKTTAGAFAFASGMLGYYTVANLMCQTALNFSFPMGDTSRFFRKRHSQAEDLKNES